MCESEILICPITYPETRQPASWLLRSLRVLQVPWSSSPWSDFVNFVLKDDLRETFNFKVALWMKKKEKDFHLVLVPLNANRWIYFTVRSSPSKSDNGTQSFSSLERLQVERKARPCSKSNKALFCFLWGTYRVSVKYWLAALLAVFKPKTIKLSNVYH